ncbi:hypothetical protein ACSAZK_06865 [Methanosarcina sp. Mfa9]|uniref:hypothetical protein n=1 Tax=Methanosarcina sp. Mfa9 TaxID=3439063 RepID=UPI003F865C0F
MSNTIEKIYGGPALFMLVVGMLLSSILFYLMFKYADEGNLLMVISIPLVISLIALVIARALASSIKDISKQQEKSDN